jgi:mRNA interferase MazF
MLNSGDVVNLDFGVPSGREAGFGHPAVVVTAQAVLDESPNVVQVVPVTKTLRGFGSEVVITADDHNGLTADSAAQCQHVRPVSIERVESVRGNVGSAILTEIRRVLGILIDVT